MWCLRMRFSLFLLVLFASACTAQPVPTGRPVVVGTTTMLCDLAQQLGAGTVEVQCLMPVGADPHVYQATPSDAATVARSALVVRNGLGLEGWVDSLLTNAGGTRPLVTASDGVDPLLHEGTPDPHFWFDAVAWENAGAGVAAALQQLHGEQSEASAQVAAARTGFEQEVRALHAWTQAQIQTIPESQRVLVTSHDAFAWYARAYGLQVHAVQGVSTAQEASQRDVIAAVEVVRARQLPMVFGETSVNGGLIEQVGREAGVPVGGPLYSDSLGEPGSGADTWAGMVVANTCMIVNGLGGTCTPPVAVEPTP